MEITGIRWLLKEHGPEKAASSLVIYMRSAESKDGKEAPPHNEIRVEPRQQRSGKTKATESVICHAVYCYTTTGKGMRRKHGERGSVGGRAALRGWTSWHREGLGVGLSRVFIAISARYFSFFFSFLMGCNSGGCLDLYVRYGVGMARGLNNPARSSHGDACPHHIPFSMNTSTGLPKNEPSLGAFLLPLVTGFQLRLYRKHSGNSTTFEQVRRRICRLHGRR